MQTITTNRSYAIVVGVSRYDHFEPLDFAGSDARKVAESLSLIGYQVQVLATDPQTGTIRREDVLRAFQEAFRTLQPGDTFLFYFSGHGARRVVKNTSGRGKRAKVSLDEKDFLLLSDTPINDYQGKGIAVAELGELLLQCRATQRIFIIDACRGATDVSPKQASAIGFPQGRPDLRFQDRIASAVRRAPGSLSNVRSVVIYACKAGQRAKESRVTGKGLFTEWLLYALSGKAGTRPTAGDIVRYARKYIDAAMQIPDLKGDDHISLGVIPPGASTVAVPLPGPSLAPIVPPGRGATSSASLSTANWRARLPLHLAYISSLLEVLPEGPGSVYFTRGEPRSGPLSGYLPDAPPARVGLSAFFIGRTEITVGMYLEYCDARQLPMPKAPGFNPDWSRLDHPIVNVSWEDASDYAAWLSRTTGGSFALPSEAQWEYAARGTEGSEFPWGNKWYDRNVWRSRTQPRDAGGTQPVGERSGGASSLGCLDMAGNVAEWCRDWYDPDFYKTAQGRSRNPVNLGFGALDKRVVRGGCWADIAPQEFTTFRRDREIPSTRSELIGFRLVCEGSTPG